MNKFLMFFSNLWRPQIAIYLVAAILGAIIGVIILAPTFEFLSERNSNPDPFSSITYILGQVRDLINGKASFVNTRLIIFFSEIGAFIGILSVFIYNYFQNRINEIDYLKTELNRDLISIIQQGENSFFEFKSTLRWDLSEDRVNKALEAVVLKTLAGFLNSPAGGSLLIGVADDGAIIGLEKDYQSLRKSNRDGFEQLLMTLVSQQLGTDVCSNVHVIFYMVDDKDICRVIIQPANHPVFIEQGKNTKLFVRTGGATRELNVREALTFAKQRWKKL